jgi:cytochrome P450
MQMTVTTFSPTLPGPRPLPIVGSRGNFVQLLRDPVAYISMLHRDYGPIAGLVSGSQTTLFAFGPDYNHQVLSHPELFLSPSFLFFPAPPESALYQLDAGLISMNGAQHKRHRKLMQPAFHKKQVESYCDDMVAITERVLDGWQVGQERDIAQEMQYVTMLISSKLLFGLDNPKNAGEVSGMVARWLAFLFDPGVAIFPYDLPGMPYWRMRRHADRMVATLQARIAEKRADPSEQHDVLAALIRTRDEDGDFMTDAELIGQANNLFSAGHETSANALIWTLCLLTLHPRVLANLVDEITGVLRGGTPTLEHLNRMPLLERVIKESMRLLPPVVFYSRAANRPFQIGPFPMPGGASALISPYLTHRMPELYPEPARFLPERWERLTPTAYEYLPFGAGPHMCIGASFAMMEIKVILAMLLQRYRLAPRPNMRLDRQVRIVMAPRHAVPMIVHDQDRRFERARMRGNVMGMVDVRA